MEFDLGFRLRPDDFPQAVKDHGEGAASHFPGIEQL